MVPHGGDDLDDFVFDDIVALSDGASDLGDDVKDLLSADEDAEQDDAVETKTKSDKDKKRKRREKEKERKAKVRLSKIKHRSKCNQRLQKRKLVETSEVPLDSITAQEPAALQDYLAGKQAKTFSTMSALELEDVQIPGRSTFLSGDSQLSQDI